jgi:hypothetical protein
MVLGRSLGSRPGIQSVHGAGAGRGLGARAGCRSGVQGARPARPRAGKSRARRAGWPELGCLGAVVSRARAWRREESRGEKRDERREREKGNRGVGGGGSLENPGRGGG